MKHKLQTLLKHKLQWLVLLTALLGVSQGVWGRQFNMGDKIYLKNFMPSGWGDAWITSSSYGWIHIWDSSSNAESLRFELESGTAGSVDAIYSVTLGVGRNYTNYIITRNESTTSPWGEWNRYESTVPNSGDMIVNNTNNSWESYTPPCSAPTVTASGASSVTSSSAVLSGSYSGGTGIGAKTFTITPSAGVSIGAVSCSGGTCTATATGLTVGTSYSYTFNVVNDCGTTSSSSSSSFIPKNSITIKISKKEPAFTPNKIYIWYNDGSDHTISGAWPGDEFDSSDENWYIKNIDVPYGSVKFIANYGSNQTSDTNISSISDDETYCYKIENNNGYKATVIDCETCDDLSTSNYTLTGSLTQTWDGSAKSVSIAAKTGYPSGTTYYTGTDGTSYSKNSSAPSAPGKYTITYEVAASSPYCAANLNFGTLIIQRSVTIRVEKPMGGDFLNSQTPQVYYWYHDGHDDYVLSASWPGDAFDSDDDDWYYKDINVPYPGLRIIVNNNNNGHQTKDIEIADITSATNYCYEIPGTKDGDKYNYNEVSCCTPPTASGFTMSPTSVTYDGNSHAVTVSPEPGYGAVSDIKYNGSSTAPTNVGEYTITADIAAEGDWCAVDDLEIGTFSITKRSQAALSITTSTENRCTGVLPLQLAVSGGSTSGVVTYAETAHTGTVSVSSSGEITASTDASITVTATMAGDATYDDVVSDPVTFTFTQSHVIYLKGSGAGGASATYPWEYMTIEVDRSSGKTTPSDLTVEFIETPDFSGGVAPNHSVTITDDNKYLLKSAKTVNDAHYYTVKAQDVSGGTCAASDASYNVYINSAPAEKCGE